MAKETAVCRGCGKTLTGTPFYMGGDAFDPITMERAKVNQYGGYVCSEACDMNSSMELEGSMPGHKRGDSLSTFARDSLRSNWG